MYNVLKIIAIAAIVTANALPSAPQHITSRNNPAAGGSDTLTVAYALTKCMCRSTCAANALAKTAVQRRLWRLVTERAVRLGANDGGSTPALLGGSLLSARKLLVSAESFAAAAAAGGFDPEVAATASACYRTLFGNDRFSEDGITVVARADGPTYVADHVYVQREEGLPRFGH